MSLCDVSGIKTGLQGTNPHRLLPHRARVPWYLFERKTLNVGDGKPNRDGGGLVEVPWQLLLMSVLLKHSSFITFSRRDFANTIKYGSKIVEILLDPENKVICFPVCNIRE